MAWTTPDTFTASVVSVAQGNVHWRDNPNYLKGELDVYARLRGLCEGRLTLTTATPVTSADVTAATTLRFAPIGGSLISVYTGSAWVVLAFTEMSIAVPATTDTLYDVFFDYNGGTPTLALTAWTNDTTRATALTTQNGVLVKTGDTQMRFLGCMRTTGVSGQTEDSFAKRYIWNYYNRRPRVMRVMESTNTWTYSTSTYQQANAAAANQLDFVLGVAEEELAVYVVANVSGNATMTLPFVAVGIDSTSAAATGCLTSSQATFNAGFPTTVHAELKTYPAVGRHTAVWLEKASSATATWYGDNGADGTQSGIHGVMWG